MPSPAGWPRARCWGGGRGPATSANLRLPACFQHVVFFIGRVIAWLVPDIPESVEVKVKRERYLAKEALAENKVGHGSSSTSSFKAFFALNLCRSTGKQEGSPVRSCSSSY